MGSLCCLNVGCGDANIITTSTDTFLVDCHNISDYSAYLPASKRIRGVFITHQHEDHYSGLRFLKEANYLIDFLIYSPYSRRYDDKSVSLKEWNEFAALRDYFVTRGTETRAPYRQEKWGKPWWDAGEAKFEIVGPDSSTANSDTRQIHDACLVIKAILGKRNCLFAGDASDANLQYITDNTINFCNDILHASHHGSIDGANLEFIKKCNAVYTLISTKTGRHDNVPHPTALSRYKNHTAKAVRRTDVDGTWEWKF